MVRRFGFFVAMLGAAFPAFAGGGIGYSATDSDGTVERVVEQRVLPGGMIGAMVSYTRADASRSFVEYAVTCEPLSYAYLGITADDITRTPNLRTVRMESDWLLNNQVRPVALVPLADDTSETPIKAMAAAVCS